MIHEEILCTFHDGRQRERNSVCILQGFGRTGGVFKETYYFRRSENRSPRLNSA